MTAALCECLRSGQKVISTLCNESNYTNTMEVNCNAAVIRADAMSILAPPNRLIALTLRYVNKTPRISEIGFYCNVSHEMKVEFSYYVLLMTILITNSFDDVFVWCERTAFNLYSDKMKIHNKLHTVHRCWTDLGASALNVCCGRHLDNDEHCAQLDEILCLGCTVKRGQF